ncbi:hypothetical protein [Candidatus Thioglobus sp.]|jgi:hypothetical protein|uniref:hypothetical protein n=1 Tax=Candidatus Thioglobus sp. TaxID=2026721 RepID=UPI001DFAD815|nr:hypothetical protein [Candidatus Thioglobus sp.]MBT3277597.1 hypothetical protein [Candidatus Thioglobus sp.]MBT3446395.1 hypothetical protein [Candidatus Thioglobus sp.]MBT3744498.1 hypothetical protein [Candidatus Thioglobus sp.]MBT4000612.1 hypothetical protein [Candidatus Thioglobus sp.]MBT4746732.1 hypothetical protein [Candidatus Thioglobus sp.]
MRVKSTWHKNQVKTIDDIAGALAFNSWRITKNQLEDLINEAFVIEKEQVFDVIKEYLCYLIQCVDRLTFDTLDQQKRQELIIALAKQSADYYHENKGERIGPGDHWQEFIQTYNARSQDYSDYEFKDGEPNYLFMRYFAEKIQQAMTAADEKWIVQQMCEIQAPKAFKALNKSVKELVSVQQIVSTAEKIQQKKNKVPRSKRQTTRQDIDYKNESSSDHII